MLSLSSSCVSSSSSEMTQSSRGICSPGTGFASLYKGGPYHRLSEGGRYLVPRTRWARNEGSQDLAPVIQGFLQASFFAYFEFFYAFTFSQKFDFFREISQCFIRYFLQDCGKCVDCGKCCFLPSRKFMNQTGIEKVLFFSIFFIFFTFFQCFFMPYLLGIFDRIVENLEIVENVGFFIELDRYIKCAFFSIFLHFYTFFTFLYALFIGCLLYTSPSPRD